DEVAAALCDDELAAGRGDLRGHRLCREVVERLPGEARPDTFCSIGIEKDLRGQRAEAEGVGGAGGAQIDVWKRRLEQDPGSGNWQSCLVDHVVHALNSSP